MRNTVQLQQLALALLDDPDGDHYGYPLCKASKLRSGVVYPMLARLLDAGWLTDSWEDPEVARSEKRPPRRIYRLTDLGRQQLGNVAASAVVARPGLSFAQVLGFCARELGGAR